MTRNESVRGNSDQVYFGHYEMVKRGRVHDLLRSLLDFLGPGATFVTRVSLKFLFLAF